jgi:hypothetical protein
VLSKGLALVNGLAFKLLGVDLSMGTRLVGGTIQMETTAIDAIGQSKGILLLELDQLVGIGLRKALEFLVKDFAIAEPIRSAYQGPVSLSADETTS